MREIIPTNNNGSIQLKFSFGGKRYAFNPLPGAHFGNKRDFATAKAIASQIQNDILAGHFDETLDRYRVSPKKVAISAKPPNKPQSLLEVWDLWVATLSLPLQTASGHYKWVRRMLDKAKPELTDTEWLVKAELSPRTFKDRLNLIRSCCKWAITQGYLENNPFECVKLRKDTPKEIKPFTLEEIKRIVEGFDRYYPHYSPFIRFLFLTGVRTSEAIGLRWTHIDFERGEICIKESMPKDLTGNGYNRIRKETKTGNIRYLPMSLTVRSLLEANRPATAQPDDLVFTKPNGSVIHLDNFRERCWRKVLESQNIPYRKLYTTRHSMISHAIEQGIPITGIAYLAGHKNTSMIIKNYAHMINRPDLPAIF